ncbi:glycosyltransferase family 4 protein [Brevibacillus dissolubilis]|uniref:glycosyltransferase family 4 protein n=1 Tax=Brevibacillus dissolubilis TaxID=1844116 RepID=UPI001116C3B3|nr:glycosyltransferase family 4 protein [Brevibacillus dissolubilis]
MKVLHLLKTETGAMWALRQIEVLRSEGVEVAVTLPTGKGKIADQYRALGVEVIPGQFDLPVRRPWTLPRVMKQLRQVVATVKPDIIHSHFVGTTYLMRLALRNNVKIPRLFQVPGPLHLEQGPYGFIDKLLATEQDHWMGSCQWTCDKYRSMGIPAERVHKALYGTKISQFVEQRTNLLRTEYNIGDETPVVGMVAYMYKPKTYLGQFVGLKGHETFIMAMKKVLEVMPQARGVIVGGPWGNAHSYEQKLQELAKTHCGDSIIFTGFRSDVGQIYRDLDAVAHPSLSENLGGAAESLLAGVPTIATNIGGFPDIVYDGETGWLVPPRDEEKLAQAIIEALSDPAEAQRRAAQGRELAVRELDVNKTARDVLAAYRTILQEVERHEAVI